MSVHPYVQSFRLIKSRGRALLAGPGFLRRIYQAFAPKERKCSADRRPSSDCLDRGGLSGNIVSSDPGMNLDEPVKDVTPANPDPVSSTGRSGTGAGVQCCCYHRMFLDTGFRRVTFGVDFRLFTELSISVRRRSEILSRGTL